MENWQPENKPCSLGIRSGNQARASPNFFFFFSTLQKAQALGSWVVAGKRKEKRLKFEDPLLRLIGPLPVFQLSAIFLQVTLKKKMEAAEMQSASKRLVTKDRGIKNENKKKEENSACIMPCTRRNYLVYPRLDPD